MKKKFLFVLAIVFVFTLSLYLTACKDINRPNTPPPTPIVDPPEITIKYGTDDLSGVDLKVLADLTDFSKKAKADAVTYEDDVRIDAVQKIERKQEKIEDVRDDDEDYTTYTKIFKRADVNEIVNRMSLAGLAQDKMVALVAYLSRGDSLRPDGITVDEKIMRSYYKFEVGVESLIRDYEDIEELEEFYSANSKQTGAYDALMRKRRKVSQEFIKIFGNDADQFARFLLEELLYANQVVDRRAVEAYGEGGDPVEKYKDYFRDVYNDYETLSFMLAFNEVVDMVRDSYSANNAGKFVQLYAYHYQYQKNDTLSLTDEEHKEYLKLSHMTTMSDEQAKRYRALDSQCYKKAYRYSDSFYQIYYSLYFTFQGKQEEYDKEIYVGGSNGQYKDGLTNASGNLSYASEMKAALNNIGSMLKITDTEHQYFLIDENTLSMNKANTAWNKLGGNNQQKVVNRIHLVNLEIEVLKLQQYSLNYKPYLNDTDFIGALQYQVKSYSADYVRTIQSYKKKDVTLNKELERLQREGATQAKIDAKLEEIGRNTAMFDCLVENYTKEANINGQMELASNVEWDKIRAEIKDALAKDYENYHKSHQTTIGHTIYVDEYFLDNLVKKTYSCGGTATQCKKNNAHEDCIKEYDTDCRISRTLSNHDSVLRHAYGSVVITYATNSDLTAYRIDEVSETFEATPGIGNGSGVSSKDAKVKPSTAKYSTDSKSGMATETIDNDVVPTLASYASNQWEGMVPNQDHITFNENEAEVDENGTVTYLVIEKDANGKDVTYKYYLEFDGWFVDKQLKWRANPGGTYDYDVRLYPGYRITKTVYREK